MIKCNVTVCGIISRSAQMRTGKEGKRQLWVSASAWLALRWPVLWDFFFSLPSGFLSNCSL